MSAEQLPRVLFERELVHRDNGERLRIMSAPGGWLLGCARMSDGPARPGFWERGRHAREVGAPHRLASGSAGTKA